MYYSAYHVVDLEIVETVDSETVGTVALEVVETADSEVAGTVDFVAAEIAETVDHQDSVV
jgi:hypothetical protein